MSKKIHPEVHQAQYDYIKKHYPNISARVREALAAIDPRFPIFDMRPGYPPRRVPRCEVCGSTDHEAVLIMPTATESGGLECPNDDELPY